MMKSQMCIGNHSASNQEWSSPTTNTTSAESEPLCVGVFVMAHIDWLSGV